MAMAVGTGTGTGTGAGAGTGTGTGATGLRERPISNLRIFRISHMLKKGNVACADTATETIGACFFFKFGCFSTNPHLF